MIGLVEEGSQLIKEHGSEAVLDAGLIAAAQKVEHYEMAGYGTLRAFANQLGDNYSAQLIDETLNEEKFTDKKLTEIAEGAVNPASA
jgi:ferritin-like metal-binding protein YciE